MKELEKIIAKMRCFMHQSFYRPNYIFNNDAYFLDFCAQKFPLIFFNQGSYASGKCQGNLKFFKVRELSGNFIICQGKLNFC